MLCLECFEKKKDSRKVPFELYFDLNPYEASFNRITSMANRALKKKNWVVSSLVTP